MEKSEAISKAKKMAKQHNQPIVVFSHSSKNYDLCAIRHFIRLFRGHPVMKEVTVMPNGEIVHVG